MNHNHPLLQKALAMEKDLIKWRRDIHQHPELGFEETRTAVMIADLLSTWDWQIRTGVGRTGIVADSGSEKPRIALRADMDALPIQEQNKVSYASKIPGIMHACGHDAHVAMLLGVARLIGEEQLSGSVRLLFQPSEEQDDDEGRSGAWRMIQDGAMEGVDMVLALHVNSDDPVGTIRVGSGTSSAGSDTLKLVISGKGGHAASPQSTINPITIAGHLIVALDSIVSRCVHPGQQAVINLGAISGGDVDNVVPEKVSLLGTIRYRETEVRELLHKHIRKVSELARSFGGDCSVNIETGYPPTRNHEQIVHAVKETAYEIIGRENVLEPLKTMGAEDFSFMADLVPGVLFRLGCKIENDIRYAHNPQFDIDEHCLPIGTAILTQTALRLIEGH